MTSTLIRPGCTLADVGGGYSPDLYERYAAAIAEATVARELLNLSGELELCREIDPHLKLILRDLIRERFCEWNRPATAAKGRW
jgi:hypothetical protein